MSRLGDRFWDKVQPDPLSGCWLWTACRQASGYGKYGIGNKVFYAHRLAYEDANGPIPDGLEIDHLCRTPACVNPEHLEAVTHRENLLRGDGFAGAQARQTHCKRGHAFDAENTSVDKLGERACRTCIRAGDRRRWRRRNDQNEGARR